MSRVEVFRYEINSTPDILFPRTKSCLNSICELTCDKHTDPLYFYGLAYVCQNLQSLVIINTNTKTNHGDMHLPYLHVILFIKEWTM